MALALVFLSPVAALFALVAFGLSRRFRILPEGVSDPLTLGLFFVIGLGGVALAVVLEVAVLYPTRVQEDLLGGHVASPLSLRHFYWQDSLMDPMAQWTFALDDEALARLAPRCQAAPGGGCLLASRTGEAFFSSASIEDGKLIVEDGSM